MLVDAVPPLMLIKTKANPDGLPIEAFDEIRAGVATDASQFWKDLTGGLRITFPVSSESLRYRLARETLLMKSAMSYSRRSRMPTGRLKHIGKVLEELRDRKRTFVTSSEASGVAELFDTFCKEQGS